MARAVAERAISYRGYKVGCTMLLWKSQVDQSSGHYGTLSCANMKPKQSGPKCCAEKALVTFAQSSGWERVVAIIIVAEPQADDVTGRKTDTLVPCYECREYLRLMPQISDDTIVLTVHNHAGNREQRTFKEVLEIFDEY
jgi:cytidine deaminase